MTTSFPPIRLPGSQDQDEVIPPALESGVRSVPERLAEDFSPLAQGVRIQVRRDVSAAYPIEIYDERGVCVSDPAIDDFGYADPEVDVAQEELLAKLAECEGGPLSEEILLAAIDTMLAIDKAVQQRRAKGGRRSF